MAVKKPTAHGLREVGAGEPRLDGGQTMIYALADPITLEIRYVGQTIAPSRRRWFHQSKSNNRRSGRLICRWCLKLIENGAGALLFELEVTPSPDEAEKRWIAHFQHAGSALLNMNSGGQAMEQCRKAERGNTKGKRMAPLQKARITLSSGPRMLKRHGHPEIADSVAKKIEQVDEAIERLIKRMGSRQAAHDYLNAEIRKRRPMWCRD